MSEHTYEELKTKKARIEHLREMVGQDPRWAQAAVVRIFEYQTADEQATDETRMHNGVGFSGADANILSSFAKQIMRGRAMTKPQMDIIYKKMPKYARQLDAIAQEKANDKD